MLAAGRRCDPLSVAAKPVGDVPRGPLADVSGHGQSVVSLGEKLRFHRFAKLSAYIGPSLWFSGQERICLLLAPEPTLLANAS